MSLKLGLDRGFVFWKTRLCCARYMMGGELSLPLLEHCGTGDPYPRTFLESRGMFADELARFPVAVTSLDIEARDVV